MILFQKYGLQLQSLQTKDLELVRKWRNADNVRKYFEYQKIISGKEQIIWFNSLDLTHNIYFIIRYGATPCGVVSLKEIDWKVGQAEAGIFMASEDYVQVYIPVVAVILLMELSFSILGLKQLRAKIHEENISAIKFNRALGYQRVSRRQHSSFALYQVDDYQFQQSANTFISTLQKIYGHQAIITFDKQDVAPYPLEVRQRFMVLKETGNEL